MAKVVTQLTMSPDGKESSRRLMPCSVVATEAADAPSERGFLRGPWAWRGLAGYEGRATFRAWLYRVATNACLRLSTR